MKTNTLTGADLNRAVAMALGLKIVKLENKGYRWYMVHTLPDGPIFGNTRHIPNYARDIIAAWPIIKGHDIALHKCGITLWMAEIDLDEGDSMRCQETDTDPQVAAMRCFVASVYGAEVELP